MKRFIILSLLSLLLAGRVFAQTEPSPSDRIQGTGINLSLWKGAATQPLDSTRSTCLNLGLISAMNQLNGLSVNILASYTMNSVNGIQVAGLAHMTGRNMNGLQVAGITNITAGTLSGLSIGGLVNITEQLNGAQIGGLANITGSDTRGLVLGGLLNVTGTQTDGVILSGLVNIAGENLNGVAASGLLNIAGENMNGVQLSGLLNIAGEKMNGVQLAAANIAIHAQGVQIGLVNYYQESLNGFQLGLINANKHTRIQLMAYGGNQTKFNLGVRFKNDRFYTILGIGSHYLDFSHKFSGSLSYRAGLSIPLYRKLSLSGDLGYQHIETFRNKDHGFPARLYGLQARLNLEYQLTQQLGLILTGGYGGSRYYGKNQTFDKGILAEGGIVWTLPRHTNTPDRK